MHSGDDFANKTKIKPTHMDYLLYRIRLLFLLFIAHS